MADVNCRRTGLALALLLVALTGRAGAQEPAAELNPHPGLTAADVVRIQLTALANNDSPHTDAGIEITFRFASPDNRRVTGPLSRFIELVKSTAYRPLINHRTRDLGPAVAGDDHTLIPVMLITADRERAAYVFMLRRRVDQACKGCWMTESVVPIDLGQATPPDRRGI